MSSSSCLLMMTSNGARRAYQDHFFISLPHNELGFCTLTAPGKKGDQS